MDYTTLANVQSAMGSLAPNANPLGVAEQSTISEFIARASRAIDRYVTKGALGSDNYFQTATIVDEIQNGQIDKDGNIVVFAHKPIVLSVSSMYYRFLPSGNWQSISISDIAIDGHKVTAFIGLYTRGTVFVKISYSGGLGASTAELPPDIIEAANILTIRYYKEARGGLEDVIGVADFGQPVYTKSMPARVREILSPYERAVAW